MPNLVIFSLSALLGYLLGSIPFGVLSTKMAGINIRDIGSGNIGATNVLRTGRKDLAAITFLGDTGKGALAVLVAYAILSFLGVAKDTRQAAMAVAGGAAFLGHLYPVWLKFKGGKGVATFFGTLFAAAWPMGLAAGFIWLVSAFFFRISSLSALMATALIPFVGFLIDQPYPFIAMSLFMSVLIFIRHRDNIKRLLKGTEPRIGQKKPSSEPDEPI